MASAIGGCVLAVAAIVAGLSGVATWYDDGPGHYAAAGPALRVGSWRGDVVEVCSADRCTTVRLVDWCACGPRGGQATLLDLSPDAFRELAPLSRGVIRVTVEGRPTPTLPPTDTE